MKGQTSGEGHSTARRDGQRAALWLSLGIVDGDSDHNLRQQLIHAIETADDDEAVLDLVIGAGDIVAQVLSARANENGFDPVAFISTLVALNESTIHLETDIGRRGRSS